MIYCSSWEDGLLPVFITILDQLVKKDVEKKMTRTITDVMEQFLQSMLEKDMEKWIQLWDQDAVFEHPYAPPGFPKK